VLIALKETSNVLVTLVVRD